MLSVVIQVLRYKYNNVKMQNPENNYTYNSDVRNWFVIVWKGGVHRQ